MLLLSLTARRHAALALLWALGVAGCSTAPNRAPVEDRRPSAGTTTPAGPAAPSTGTPSTSSAPSTASGPGDSGKTLPGSDNAGKPGFHTVKPGETLIRIGLENGQNWRDIARWNGIDNPNLIEVGQVLRVAPPGVEPGAALPRPVGATPRIETRPGDPKATTAAAGAASSAAPATTTATGPAPAVAAPATTAAPPTAPAAAPVREADEDLNWLWPAAGPVLANFDEGRNVKGLAIGGKSGDAVLAAADGRVVYAGSGLRGYGNLVIVKHNNTFLTAYAHNQALLVKEDQVVRRGQKIAEMGSTDADKVQLHFEIRRQGKPIDPTRLLPPR